MDKVAYISGETFLYWSSIILALGALTAVGVFLSMFLRTKGNGPSAIFLVPTAVILSVLCARFIHWYCRADSYTSLKAAMTDFSGGDYALMGVFAGCVISACVLWVVRLIKDLPQALDCMALAGAAGIGVGRLSGFFGDGNRGAILQGITELPLVCPVINPVSGAVEYRLATFLLQAIAAGIIFAILLIFYLLPRKKHPLRRGDTTLLFLSLYCATQAVLDSTRYDSLFMRSNGFVSFVQVLSAVGLLIPVVVFSVRMVRAMGMRRWFYSLWSLLAAALGGAGYMEYYVQRHGDQAQFAYTVMSGCLLAVVVLTLFIRALGIHGKKKAAPPAA